MSLGWYPLVSTPLKTPLKTPALEDLLRLDLPLKEARVSWVEGMETLYLSELLRRTGGT